MNKIRLQELAGVQLDEGTRMSKLDIQEAINLIEIIEKIGVEDPEKVKKTLAKLKKLLIDAKKGIE